MNTVLISPAPAAFTGATFSVGALDWLSANSDSITPAAVIVTALAAVIFGFYNARSGRMNTASNDLIAKSAAEANRINERDITASIISQLERSGKDKMYLDDFMKSIRK